MIKEMTKRYLGNEKGQALSEYFLLIASVAVALSASFKLFGQILMEYYTTITKWVSMPFP